MMDHMPPPGPSEDYFDPLARNFGALCESERYVGPHRFVAAGYRTDGPRGATDPEIVLVANHEDLVHQFDVTRLELQDNQPFLFQSIGHTLTDAQTRAAVKALARAVKRHPRQPYDLHPLFGEIVADVARGGDGSVSETALVTSFPRTAVPLEGGVTMWIEPPAKRDYLELAVSTVWPSPFGTSEMRETFHPAVISRELIMGGATGVVGPGAMSGQMGPLEGMGPFEGMK